LSDSPKGRSEDQKLARPEEILPRLTFVTKKKEYCGITLWRSAFEVLPFLHVFHQRIAHIIPYLRDMNLKLTKEIVMHGQT
jgi:hypothetical protein